MSDEMLLQLNRQHAEGMAKYTYFLLAASGAALAYALNDLKGEALSWVVAPALISVLLWLGSFFCGCRQINYVQSALNSNYQLLQLHAGTHPAQPRHPQEFQIAAEVTKAAIDSKNNSAAMFYRLQFWFLGAGACSFALWRVTQMFLLAA
jgi:hypothetical protein